MRSEEVGVLCFRELFEILGCNKPFFVGYFSEKKILWLFLLDLRPISASLILMRQNKIVFIILNFVELVKFIFIESLSLAIGNQLGVVYFQEFGKIFKCMSS